MTRYGLMVALFWGLVGVTGWANASPEAHFADVPPCHWAFEAVNEMAELGIFIGFPPEDSFLSVNALRQVFEGLRCGAPEWSLRFLTGAPRELGQQAEVLGFALESDLVELTPERAEIRFVATVTYVVDAQQLSETREGVAEARRFADGWRVDYAGLRATGWPFFPAGEELGEAFELPSSLIASFRGERAWRVSGD